MWNEQKLPNMPNLKFLRLESIESLDVIVNNQQLKHLKIDQEGNKLDDLDSLSLFDKLSHLSIENANNINTHNLPQLDSLEKLSLINSGITSIDFLSKFSKLNDVNLNNNPIPANLSDSLIELKKSMNLTCLAFYNSPAYEKLCKLEISISKETEDSIKECLGLCKKEKINVYDLLKRNISNIQINSIQMFDDMVQSGMFDIINPEKLLFKVENFEQINEKDIQKIANVLPNIKIHNFKGLTPEKIEALGNQNFYIEGDLLART
ncbi:MAG: hypothetical protein J6A89_07375 [Clostridia bacterium]|nr:hypothetical protein [Clostridia bacterium]